MPGREGKPDPWATAHYADWCALAGTYSAWTTASDGASSSVPAVSTVHSRVALQRSDGLREPWSLTTAMGSSLTM